MHHNYSNKLDDRIIYDLFSLLSSSSKGSDFALAGRTCNILPSKIEPSNSLYALTACSGIKNATVPKPFGFLVVRSIGKLTSLRGPI